MALASYLTVGVPSTFADNNIVLSEVKVDGAAVTDVALIKNVSGLVVGNSVSRDDLQRAVHQVFGLGLFSDVHLEGEDDSGKLKLTIKVTELPHLDRIVLKGNNKIKEKDFSLTLKHGQTVGPSALKDASHAIRHTYQQKGFYLVEVKSELAPTAVSGESDAVFQIKEHDPVGVAAVEFQGNTQVAGKDLAGKMKNKPRGFLRSLFGSGHFNRDKYADDQKAVTDFYRKKGFLDAVIVSDTIILNDAKTDVTIRMVVNEGPRYYFGATTFAGETALKEDQLRRALKYREGDVYNQEHFDKSQEEMYNAYLEEGYLYVRISDETKTQDSTVNVAYDISEGVPAHINRIDITGNSKTKDKVIRRELAVYPGQTFRRSSLQRSLRNVMLLNYFSNVTPEFHQLPDGRVDLSLKVDEKPTGQIQVGGGYSEQDHLVGTVSLGIPNLFGGGQSANVQVEFGSLRQSYTLSFTEPWFMDTPTTVGFDIQRLDRIYDDPYIVGTQDYTEKSSGATMRLGRRLRWPDDYFSVYWNYRWENQRYTNFSSPAVSSLFTGSNGVISSTTFTMQRDSRDLPEFPTSGNRSSYSIEFGGGALGGQWNYTKHTISHSRYWKLWKGFTFGPIWNLGALSAGPGLTDAPYSQLFYAGGIRSDAMIRGYDDRSIVVAEDTVRTRPPAYTLPQDSISDAATGLKYQYASPQLRRGRAFFVTNAQITFPIVKQQIHGLLFFDAGNVWQDAARISLSDLYTAYGFGFRLAVPGVGTLGFDFGIPLRGVGKGHLKPHFQFGGSF
ncbi:MAG: outer membrane protein assembly factor BamA [candidate division Zixibacteria bacterium]|nr:outer membrane protein assembly factor BamA [candidate division Zixibacteria bacterium]